MLLRRAPVRGLPPRLRLRLPPGLHPHLALSTSTPAPITTYLTSTHGVPPAVAAAMASLLDEPTLRRMTREQLVAFASSVAAEQAEHARFAGKPWSLVRVVSRKHASEFDVGVRDGASLFDAAKGPDADVVPPKADVGGKAVAPGSVLGEYLACGGQMMCSTCHVYLDEESFKAYGPPSENEQDLLDVAWEPRDDASRLGCQLHIRKGVPLTVEIPEQAVDRYGKH